MIEAYASHPELFDRYAASWGEPTEDLWVRRDDDDAGFHVLTFGQQPRVARLATLGLGSCPTDDGSTIAVELLVTLGAAELAAVGSRRVSEFLRGSASLRSKGQ